jgi:Ca-activated chloride channel family protein
MQYMPALPRTLARHEIDGTAELSFGRGWSARTRPRATGELVERPDGPGLLRFAVGGCAVLQSGDRTVLAFFIRRPRLGPEIGQRGLAISALRHGAAAMGVHLALGLVLVAAVTPEAAMSAGNEPMPPSDDVIDLYAVPPDPEPAPPPVEAAREATPLPANRPTAPTPGMHPARGSASPGPAHSTPSSSPREASPNDALEQLEQSLTASPAAGSLREALGAIDVAPSSGGATPGYRLALPVSAIPGLGLGRRGGEGPGGPLEVPMGNTKGAGRFGPPIPGDPGVRSLVTDPGTPRGEGPTIDRAAVQRVINQHQHEIVRCYERALLSTPGLSGTVRMSWVIAPGGRVSSVSVTRSTLGNSGVSACMSAAIRRWQFPSPNGGPVTINFPWVVRPATQ